jgi:hypothetical protein
MHTPGVLTRSHEAHHARSSMSQPNSPTPWLQSTQLGPQGWEPKNQSDIAKRMTMMSPVMALFAKSTSPFGEFEVSLAVRMFGSGRG